jgi:hypothetical protein
MAYDWGMGGSGALSGAATGAAVGGGPGAAIGGGLGALMGFFGGDKKDKMKKVSTMTKGQQALLSQLEQMLGPQGQMGQGYQGALGLQNQLMDPSSQAVQQFSQPYMNQFEQQTVPGLAERFAGMGANGGALSSSGFGQALGAAGGNLQSNLAQLKAMLGQQAAQSLMGQYGGLTQTALGAQPFAYQQKAPSADQGFMQSWAQGGFPGLKEVSGMFGGGGGGSGANPSSLTNTYDQMFRTGAWT